MSFCSQLWIFYESWQMMMMMSIHSSQKISWGERKYVYVFTSTWNKKCSVVTCRHTLCNLSFWSPSPNILSSSSSEHLPVIFFVLLQVVVPVPAGTKAGAHLQGPAQTAALISEEKQTQLLLVVQQEQKWEQVLPSNPFQTILWIYELKADIYG